jgi:hypothetical protein
MLPTFLDNHFVSYKNHNIILDGQCRPSDATKHTLMALPTRAKFGVGLAKNLESDFRDDRYDVMGTLKCLKLLLKYCSTSLLIK